MLGIACHAVKKWIVHYPIVEGEQKQLLLIKCSECVTTKCNMKFPNSSILTRPILDGPSQLVKTNYGLIKALD